MQALNKQFTPLTILVLVVVALSIQCSRNQETGKKQIILISIATLRGDHITPYGYSRDTSPQLAKLVDDSVY